MAEEIRAETIHRGGNDRDWLRALLIPLTILAWIVVVIIALWVLSHLVKTILTLVLSGIVAFALTPLVRLLSRVMPRGLAIGVAYTIGFSIILGMMALIIATVATQVTSLVHELPAYVKLTQRHEGQILRILRPFGVTHVSLQHAQQQAIAHLQSIGTTAASDSLTIFTGILGTLVDIVLILILSVYLTANGSKIADRLRRETPGPHRRHTALFIAIVNRVVGGYIRGTLTLAGLIGFLVGAGMFFLGIPYAVLLGVLAFFMEFVPIVGVLISGAVCVALSLIVGPFPLRPLLVLGYFVLVHVVEGDVVGPRIMGNAVGIHPATALLALVAGTELFGFWGTLFAAPLAGLVQAVGTAAWIELKGGDPRAVLETVKAEVDEEASSKAEEVGEQTSQARAGPAGSASE